jgi:hypothetical protein
VGVGEREEHVREEHVREERVSEERGLTVRWRGRERERERKEAGKETDGLPQQ